jgi:PGF-pre-PGF domain-containing protein
MKAKPIKGLLILLFLLLIPSVWALSSPSLTSPPNGAINVSTAPTFQWSAVLGAIYDLQVSKSPDFSQLVLDRTGLVLPFYTAGIWEPPLLPNTIYYWRVRARTLSETSDWSQVWSFRTAGLEIAGVRITELTSTSATISWKTNRPTSGTVYYGTSKEFVLTPAVSPSLSATEHSVKLIGLLPDTTYYFKIEVVSGLERSTDDNNGNYYCFRTQKLELPFNFLTVEGASFTLPELGVDLSYLQKIPQNIRELIPTTGFLLVSPENLFLVLSTSSDKGWARVTGWSLPPVTIGGFEVGVILAKSVFISKEGQPVSIEALLANPREYHLKLIKVTGVRRQFSILLKLGKDVPLTVGYITTNPQSNLQLLRGGMERVKEIVENCNPSLLKGLLGLEEKRILVFSFEKDYWFDSWSETNGIVISTGKMMDTLRCLFKGFGEVLDFDPDVPLLYEVGEKLDYKEVGSVSDITSNPASYRNQVVKLTVNEFNLRVSVRRALQVLVPSLPADVSLEGGVNWSSMSFPPSMSDLLLSLGASSDPLEKSPDYSAGKYVVIGRIITASQIDDSWPEYPLLLVYRKEKVGEIDWSEVGRGVADFVENQVAKLAWTLSRPLPQIKDLKVLPPELVRLIPDASILRTETVRVAKKVELFVKQAIDNLELNLENICVTKMRAKFAGMVENVRVSVRKLSETEVPVPRPENLGVYAYFEIQVGTSTVESEISFSVSKTWLKNQGADKESVKLLRYRVQGWENLKTDCTGENETDYLYTATTPGFSIFSVVVSIAGAAPAPRGLPLLPLTIIGVAGAGGITFYTLRRRALRRRVVAVVPKFCRKCGASLTPGAKFCRKCGAKVIAKEPAKMCLD